LKPTKKFSRDVNTHPWQSQTTPTMKVCEI
jgi:hypothetical protein